MNISYIKSVEHLEQLLIIGIICQAISGDEAMQIIKDYWNLLLTKHSKYDKI